VSGRGKQTTEKSAKTVLSLPSLRRQPTEEGSGMLEIVAAAGLVAAVVVALTRAAPPTEPRPVVRHRVPVAAGARMNDPMDSIFFDDPADGFQVGSDLPCPWCRAATAESDRRCPSCSQPFG
jgi:hypothetical protein